MYMKVYMHIYTNIQTFVHYQIDKIKDFKEIK